jgi:hypothetical protein
MNSEITLPSGAILKIYDAPFAESQALLNAVLKEAQNLNISLTDNVEGVFKDAFCNLMTSAVIEKCLQPCLIRSTIDGLKIDKDTFESIERRGDYFTVRIEVAWANVGPFMKNLPQLFKDIFEKIGSYQKQK